MQSFQKILTITSCVEVHSGVSAAGKPWALHEVHAVDENGVPVDVKLKSFADLPLNEPIEFKCEEENHEKYGKSYTLVPPKGVGKRPNAGTSNGALEARVKALEENVEWLKEQLGIRTHAGLQPTPVPTSAAPVPPPAPAPAPASGGFAPPPPPAPAGMASDDDIPF